MLPTLYMCSSLGILRIYSIYDLTIDFWSSKPTHAPSNTEPGSKCLSCQPLVGTYTNIPSLFLWERVKNSRKLIENMSSCTKPSIPSCQPHALLHSPCKMTNVAGFTLALSNRNPNNYSADAQRTRILVTWFGKAPWQSVIWKHVTFDLGLTNRGLSILQAILVCGYPCSISIALSSWRW